MPRSILTALKIVVASAFVLALIIWAQAHLSWEELLETATRIAPTDWLLAAVLVFISHALRVTRIQSAYKPFRTLLWIDVAGVSLLHNTLSFLLPMRLGELALPVLSKQKLDVTYSVSASTLLLVRLFDAHFLLLLLVFFASDIWLNEKGLIFCSIFILSSPAALLGLRQISKKIKGLQGLLPLISNWRLLTILYLQTAGLWSIKLVALAYLAANLGELTIDHAWLATIIADASSLSPLTGFANAGTYEVAFALPLLPLGYANDQILAAALNLHVFILVTNMVAGCCGLLFWASSRHKHISSI